MQPDGGEGLAKRKDVIARWGLKEAWSKAAARWTRTGSRGLPGRTSEPLIAKSTAIKDRGGKSGGRAVKAVDLTSGDLRRVLGALNHGLARADFGLADGARGLHIHDDAELHINEIVVGIGEERWPPHRSRPLCSRVGWRDELRGGVARRTKGRIIKGCQILLYCPARRLRITCLLPFRARDRALFVGISLDQARIHGKPFAANEAGCDTSLDHTLEYLTKDAAVAEALIASTRERRMIRDL